MFIVRSAGLPSRKRRARGVSATVASIRTLSAGFRIVSADVRLLSARVRRFRSLSAGRFFANFASARSNSALNMAMMTWAVAPASAIRSKSSKSIFISANFPFRFICWLVECLSEGHRTTSPSKVLRLVRALAICWLEPCRRFGP